jgi:hypothetical protein
MVIDREGRLFGKVSVIDILIICVVLIAVAGIGYKFSTSNISGPFTKVDHIQVVFYQEEIPDYVANAVKNGDPVRESLQYSDFGTVVDVQIGDAVSWVETDSGENVPAPKPGYSSVYITMDAKGIIGENGVTIDNSVYYVGKTIELYVGNATFEGRIADVRKKG